MFSSLAAALSYQCGEAFARLLSRVKTGDGARLGLLELRSRNVNPERVLALRGALLRYCRHDTCWWCCEDFYVESRLRLTPAPAVDRRMGSDKGEGPDAAITSRSARQYNEFRRFIAGYLAVLTVGSSSAAVDRRFVEYVLELPQGITGRVVDLLRRAATHTITLRSRSIGIEVLQHVGARLPTISSQRA